MGVLCSNRSVPTQWDQSSSPRQDSWGTGWEFPSGGKDTHETQSFSYSAYVGLEVKIFISQVRVSV